MPIVTFPWQHNEFQTLFIQKGKSEFSSFEKYYLLIQWVWANMEITQQRYNFGATNETFFILGRKRSNNECVSVVTS